MSTEIKCPNCSHTFPIEEVMAEEYKKDLRDKMLSFTKQKEEEFNKKLNEVAQQKLLQEQEMGKQLAQQKQQFDQQKQLQIQLFETD